MGIITGDVNHLKNKLAFYEAQIRMKMKHYNGVYANDQEDFFCSSEYDPTTSSVDSHYKRTTTHVRQSDKSLQDPEVLVLMAAVWELRREIDRLQSGNGLS